MRQYWCYSLLRVNLSLLSKYFFLFYPRKLNAFWTDIIRSRSPQVLQALLHYKYHWQLVQVFCHNKLFMFTIVIRIDTTFLHSYLITRPIKPYVDCLPIVGFQRILWCWVAYCIIFYYSSLVFYLYILQILSWVNDESRFYFLLFHSSSSVWQQIYFILRGSTQI